MLPGIVGCLQANEALKLIAGYGEPLLGRLLTFDAQTTRFAEVKVRRDPACPVCGEGRPGAMLHSVNAHEKRDEASPAA